MTCVTHKSVLGVLNIGTWLVVLKYDTMSLSEMMQCKLLSQKAKQVVGHAEASDTV